MPGAGSKDLNFIRPDWPAPDNIRAFSTTRDGGVSRPPHDGFNLADHVGDAPPAVAANRALLAEYLALPAEPCWLRQVHGRVVALANRPLHPEADASIALDANEVCAVLTADCLPVLFCDREGRAVAAAHAGWRGLAGGVLEATLEKLCELAACRSRDVLVWLGPAIGPANFEVGAEVLQAFAEHARNQRAFKPRGEGKWLADIYTLARARLAGAGVRHIYGGDYCTYSDSARFFSYRRDGVTGRMASLIWRSA